MRDPNWYEVRAVELRAQIEEAKHPVAIMVLTQLAEAYEMMGRISREAASRKFT